MRKLLLALSLALLPGANLGLAGSAVAAPPADPGASGAAIVQTALRYLGYAYTTVGNSPSTGFSCIGFVSYVYQANGVPLPDDLGGAMAYAPAVAFSDLQPGDVLFFQNTVWAGLSHTAIYLGGGRFIQAEWYNRGVVTSSFTDDPVDGNYWIDHYLGANRPWTGAALYTAPAPASSLSTPSAPPSPPKPKLQDGPRAHVQVPGLNVRIRPSLSAPITRLATHGTTVVVLKQYRIWDWVQLSNGSFGWVAGTAIGEGNASPAGGGLASQPVSLTTVSVNGLRVHVRPNLAAPSVASAFHGQKLLVLQRWHSWMRIVLANGTGGWVYSPFLGLKIARPAMPRHVVKGQRHASAHPAGPMIIAATMRLHVRPALRAPIVGLAAAGAPVRVLGTWRAWVDVRARSGVSGWIYGAYVHPACPSCK